MIFYFSKPRLLTCVLKDLYNSLPELNSANGERTMPAMDASAHGWMVNTAVRNYWRVQAWMELDDLIQEGHLHYQRLLNKYPDVTDKPHLMQLFKRIFTNHIHDLAKKRMRTPEQTFSVTLNDNPDISGVLDKVGSEPELASFCAFLSQAPKPVQDVIALLTKEGDRLAIRAQYRIRKNGTRETVNERLCRLTGYDPQSIDLAWLTRAYLSLT